MRNEMSSMLILPVRLGNGIQFSEFLGIDKPFWMEAYSDFNAPNVLVFLLNAIIISLGFASAFRINSRAVLSIIGFHVIYSLSSALVRLAGWRFILPADWIIYVFYALGLVELIVIFFQVAFKLDLKYLVSEWVAYKDGKKSM